MKIERDSDACSGARYAQERKSKSIDRAKASDTRRRAQDTPLKKHYPGEALQSMAVHGRGKKELSLSS